MPDNDIRRADAAQSIPDTLGVHAQPIADPVLPTILDVLERWHAETHAGSFRLCEVRPCRDVMVATYGRYQ